jgi:hypothetical protein
MEKFAITLPFPFVKVDAVVVVIAAESDGKSVDLEPVGLLCVSSGFFDLSDHTVIHIRLLKKKGTRTQGPVPNGWRIIVETPRSWRFSSNEKDACSIEENRKDVNSGNRNQPGSTVPSA